MGNLSGNQLEELVASIGGLTSLVRLLVARNQLRELPAAMGKLGKLQYLDAAENHLSNVPSSLLTDTSLSEMWLNGNPMDRLKLQETPGFDKFLERRKLRIDSKIEANVIG